MIKKVLANSLLVFFSIFVFLVIAESLVRVREVYKNGGFKNVTARVMDDDKFGWVLNTELDSSKIVYKNRCGEDVKTENYTNKLIVKFPTCDREEWKKRKRVLVIGDSYTHGHEVSTGHAYYDVLEKLLGEGYAVFAAGVGGYGSVQEFMMLEEIYNQVRPNMVIWQLCGNDISNNRYKLDSSSFLNNQRRRPYLDLPTGRIELKDPGFWLFDISLLFKYSFSLALKLDSTYDLGILKACDSIIALTPEESKEETQKSLKTIDYVLKKIRNKHPNMSVIGFNVSERGDAEFNKIFLSNGYHYMEKFYEYVNNIKGTNCKPLDGHWNIFGNKVSGEHIYNLLNEKKLF